MPLPSRAAECCHPLAEPQLARPGCTQPSLTRPSSRQSQVNSCQRQSLLWGPRTGSSLLCSPLHPLAQQSGNCLSPPTQARSLLCPQRLRFSLEKPSARLRWPRGCPIHRGVGVGPEPRGRGASVRSPRLPGPQCPPIQCWGEITVFEVHAETTPFYRQALMN